MFIGSGCLAQGTTRLLPDQFSWRLVKCILSLDYYDIWPQNFLCSLAGYHQAGRIREVLTGACSITQYNKFAKQMKSTSHAIFRCFINYPLLITFRGLTLQSDIVETSCIHYPVLTTMLPLIHLHLNQQSERLALSWL